MPQILLNGLAYLRSKKGTSGYPFCFLALYALTYMANAVYNTFIPVYLNHNGYSQAEVGTLLALGPFVAAFAIPLWGLAGDRAANKNPILKLLVLGSAAAIVLYPLINNYFYLFAVISIFTCFQSSINPISDAITLEYLEVKKRNFGLIRMAGTVGFALMSVIAGTIAKQNINYIFVLFFMIAAVTFFSVLQLPLVKGHQSKGIKVSPWLLMKNRELVILISLNFVIQATFGFYYSFFPIYFKQSGGSSALLGWAMLVTSLSEIPFLLFADRIIKRFGIKLTLLASVLVISVRWGLLHYITDVNTILAIGVLHGFSFIVFAFCMATYINKNVPKELRASGQTMNALLCMGIARTIGSAAGGFLSDKAGIGQVFLYTSSIGFIVLIVFSIIFFTPTVFKSRN